MLSWTFFVNKFHSYPFPLNQIFGQSSLLAAMSVCACLCYHLHTLEDAQVIQSLSRADDDNNNNEDNHQKYNHKDNHNDKKNICIQNF